jgi:hypothetical protein
MKINQHIKLVVLATMLLLSGIAVAQENNVFRAQSLLGAGKNDEARWCIDSAVRHPESAKMAEAWTLRAYVYLEFHKKTEKNKLNSEIRDTIVSSLIISNSLNPDAQIQSSNTKLLSNLAVNYFNMARILLQDSLRYDASSKAFENFKRLIKIADPAYDLTPRTIEYNQAVGYLFSEMFNKDNSNTKAMETAKVALLKVLELQPDDANANMNMGLMYLNNGVNLIQTIDDVADFKELEVIQDNLIKLAKQSEQFLLKVYEKDNNNKKVVEALYYNYRILNNQAKKLEFLERCNVLGIQVSVD